MRSSVLFSFVLFFTIVVVGQDSKVDKLPFEVPSKHISVLLVSDPNCPLMLSGPTKVVGWPSGGLSLDYTLQNVSDLNVESFTIQETDWFDSTGYEMSAEMRENLFFLPLMTISRQDGGESETFARFDGNGAGKSFLYPRNKIWIAMVTKVKLSDGTIYDATKKYGELESFLDDQFNQFVESKINLDQREKNVREFVDKLVTVKK